MPQYSTVFRRIQGYILTHVTLDKAFDDRCMCTFVSGQVRNRRRRCAVDSSGLNLSNTNLWRKHKWGVGPESRGWIKIHALTDVDSGEIIAYILSTDKMGDNTAFRKLMNIAWDMGHRFSHVFADSAYEAKENWKDSGEKKYTLVVRFKRNCNGKSNGCYERGIAARQFLAMSYEEWKKKVEYGRRWRVEGIFSDFKRIMSETIDSITDIGIVVEVAMKVIMFNLYKESRSDLMCITGNGIPVGSGIPLMT